MSKQTAYQSVRGMKDITAPESQYFEYLLNVLKSVIKSYGYQPFHPPVLESTALFSRSIGEATDVVEKEMFSFDDHGDNLTMRPEATAGIARAVVQHGLTFGTHKLWTAGPMFRRERPQKGRYRQFNQFSVECFGIAEPELDAEQIILLSEIWAELGINNAVRLEINTLGSAEVRANYRQALVAYFEENYAQLDEESQKRLAKNPLRILDSKNPQVQAVNINAPKLTDYLDEYSATHFKRVTDLLDAAGVDYRVNPLLVRGLDYYNHTVFEWITDDLGAQGTICGGGRYDGLTEYIGGKFTPGIGFAIGMERVLLLLEALEKLPSLTSNSLAYLVLLGEPAKEFGLGLASQLRAHYRDKIIVTNLQNISMKAQLKKADQSGSQYALIIGETELESRVVLVKNLFKGTQESVSFDAILDYFID